MKKTSKALALALALVLAIGILPMTALAVAPDLTALEVKGVDTGWKAADLLTYDKVLAGSVELALTPALLNDTALNIVSTITETTTPVARYLTAAADATIIGTSSNFASASALNTAVASAGADATNTKTAMIPGDVIWILCGTADSDTDQQFLRIVINQEADGIITGGSTVKNAIISVIIPTNIDFTLNPLQLGTNTAGNQITTTDYRVINKSEAAVKVSFNITATAQSDVTLVANNSTLKKSDATETSKKIYFAALGAKGITADNPTFAAPSQGTYAYDAAVAGALVPFDTTSKKSAISFVLGGLKDASNLADNDAGAASFQFYGELNTYAAWKPGDVTVSGAYTLQAMRGDDYTALQAYTNQGAEDPIPTRPSKLIGLNILPGAAAADVTLTAGAAAVTKSVSASTLKDNGYKIQLSGSPATITVGSATSAYVYPTTDYTYSAGVLTFKPATTVASMPLKITAGSDTYLITFTVT